MNAQTPLRMPIAANAFHSWRNPQSAFKLARRQLEKIYAFRNASIRTKIRVCRGKVGIETVVAPPIYRAMQRDMERFGEQMGIVTPVLGRFETAYRREATL